MLIFHKEESMVKQISFLFLVGFVLTSCGGGGGNSGYGTPTNSECTSSSTNICITVVNTDGGRKYAVNGSTQANITLTAGSTYTLDQVSSNNSGHQIRISTTANGTHNSGTAFTGASIAVSGTPGSSGSGLTISPTASTTSPLYYYCENHPGMGGTIIISGGAGSGYQVPAKIDAYD